MTIQEAIQQLATKNGKFKGKNRLCKVVSVNEASRTCDVVDIADDTDILGARLQVASAPGIYLKPAIESIVMVIPINDFEYAVVMSSAVDSIMLLDGSYGGLIKVGELVDKVNKLERQVNDLLTTLQGIVTPSAGSPFAPFFTSFQPLVPTQVVDIENPLITHGTV